MVDAGPWVPRRQRPPKIYQPRARRTCYGELVQIDGSEHAWFEQRAAMHAAGVCQRFDEPAFCANSSSAKGPVERAHLTLQDRLVKELRLRGISTVAEANAYAPSFIAAYNARFAKPPRSDFNAHRLLRDDEDLDLLMTWRETRRVTKSLTLAIDCSG
jgi:hypothetical protein